MLLKLYISMFVEAVILHQITEKRFSKSTFGTSSFGNNTLCISCLCLRSVFAVLVEKNCIYMKIGRPAMLAYCVFLHGSDFPNCTWVSSYNLGFFCFPFTFLFYLVYPYFT
ncbi:hypothetical protein MtrunA17_Chr5g0425011 [Medicago truncatula]|uniref:Transmembrane protein n=1 Tax=Medicago truncatula TaxID=3880 RepID=A0A396HRM6_MEDTR|nr:hypothetical protein MtrunA17_Chr5g0425011 [Medicago truncatula]